MTPEDLGAWLLSAGLVAEPPRVDQRLLLAAHDLRSAIIDGVESTLEGRAPPRSAIATLNYWLDQLPSAAPRVELAEGVVRVVERSWPEVTRAALTQLALDAARALSDEESSGLKMCEAENCAILFCDRSPGSARRWCSMKACGNRAKVSAHRERRRKGSG